MTDKRCEYSPLECSIIYQQIERRARYRQEFLRKRSDPCMHAKEGGYVFDDALQRFMSMKSCQLDHFRSNTRTSIFGICAVVLPMVVYGTLIYMQRSERERLIRCGQIRYKDRNFKLQ